MKPTPLTIELPLELLERVTAAARAAGLSEGEWIVRLVLKELPSNYADEVRKLADLRGVAETGVDEA